MEQGFIDGIQKMVNDYGKNTLLDARKAKSMLADFTQNPFPKETNLLKQLLDANCANIINEAANVAEVKTALVRRLEDEHSISPKGSAEMLDLLGLVLRGDTSRTKIQSTDSTSEAQAALERGLEHRGDTTRTGIQNTDSARKGAQAALERGMKHLYKNKDYDNAIKEFNETIRLDPKNAEAYAKLCT